ncbi:MAG: amidohydrolase [Firmicutes bacterium]|nr:amidohydrolase [Bacillota bacterium]
MGTSNTKTADKIITSNLVYPGRGREVFAGGAAVRGDRILAVGSEEELQAFVGPDTEVYAYEDKLLLPGIIDSHIHITMGAMMDDNDINLEGTRSAEECVDIVRDYLQRHPETKLILASGWMISAWDDQELPRKEMLDEISRDIPICLPTADGWLVWVNSKALELFGYTPEKVQGEDCFYIKKDEQGELTGVLYNKGADPVYFMMMDIDRDDAKRMLRHSIGRFNTFGITTVGDLSNEHVINREPEGFAIYRELEQQGELTCRIFVYPAIDRDLTFARAKELQRQYSSGLVRMPGLKAYQDGVIDAYTGVLVEPYVDDPENPEKNAVPIHTQEELNAKVTAANGEGFPVRIHCTGDGAVRMSLNAFEASGKANGSHGLRNCIEHIEMLHEGDYERFGQLDVMACKQPAHLLLCTESFMIDAIGEERWHTSHPFQSIIDAGGTVNMSTDYPIIDIDPFTNIYAALTRRTTGGELMGTNPDDVMDIWETLEGYTYLGAYTLGQEEELGTLEAGKKADIAVLDGRIIDDKPEDILGRSALLTIMDGKVVHRRGES